MTALASHTVSLPSPARATLARGPRAVFVPTVAELAAIYQEDVNLVVLKRRLAANVQPVVAAIASGPEFVATAHVQVMLPDLSSLPFADRDGAAALIADMTLWIQAFADPFDCERVDLRICHCSKLLCPRFHIDHVPVRLVCAYAGPSLQWLAEADVDRSFLGYRAGGFSDEESGLIRRPDAPQQLPAQAIAICRVDIWPGLAGLASVHRSPPTPWEGPGRIVMTLDMI